MLRALDSAIHPLEVGKWVVTHVIMYRYMDYGVKA